MRQGMAAMTTGSERTSSPEWRLVSHDGTGASGLLAARNDAVRELRESSQVRREQRVPRLDPDAYQVQGEQSATIGASAAPRKNAQREGGHVGEVVPRARTVVRRHRCDAWFCRACGPRKGRRVAENIEAEVRSWPAPPLMLTLTVDRASFPQGPESAYDAVAGDQRLIGKLLYALRRVASERGGYIGRYIIALEFQGCTGDGWPHWHVLLETRTGRVPREVVQEAWRIWRDVWNVGGLDFQEGRQRGAPGRYVAKYLTKGIVPPPWVSQRRTDRAIKMVQGSRGEFAVRPLVGESRCRRPAPPGLRQPRSPFPRSNEDRLVRCGQSVRIFHQLLDAAGCVELELFGGNLPGSLDDWNELLRGQGFPELAELRGAAGALLVPPGVPHTWFQDGSPQRVWLAERVRARLPALRERQRARWPAWQEAKQRACNVGAARAAPA
jgi:hypothetical protein